MALCTGHNKHGDPCKRPAIVGGTVCASHGGRAPQVRAAAQRRIAKARLEGEVGRLLEDMAHDPVPDLIDGLLIAVEHCARMVAVYREVAGTREPLGINRFDEEVADPGVEQYRHWLDQWAKITKLALDAGIDERRTRIVEADAKRMFTAIAKALDAMQATAEQRAAFKTTLAGELRELEQGDAISASA